jgi:polysaccharide pyruvyl transferase WcaK-like protein
VNQPRNAPTIGLLGPFGYGNLGDAAIQQSMIQAIYRRFPNAQIIAFSMNPKDTQARHHIKAFPLTRVVEAEPSGEETPAGTRRNWARQLSWRLVNHPNRLVRLVEHVAVRGPAEIVLMVRAYRHLSSLDVLIVSGGGQLDDLWGGPWKHPYALYKFTLLARLQKIAVMIVSVGYEQVTTFPGKFFVKGAIDRASYRSYRDQRSKQELARLGLDTSAISCVYPDLAHSLEIGGTRTVKDFDPEARVVGLNIVSYHDPKFWPVKDPAIYQTYLAKIVSFMQWLIRENYRIVLIRSDIGLDMSAIADALAMLKQTGQPIPAGQMIEADINTVEDLIETLSGVDFVVASRLHTVLLSMRVSKPVLALSFQSKIDSLMQDAGLADYCLPISSFTPEALVQTFSTLQAQRAVLAEQIARRSQAYRAALSEQYDGIFQRIDGLPA